MLVNQLLAGRCLQEIEAAIFAAAALAAYCGDDVARLADTEGIAGELLYPPDEIFYDYSLAERKSHGIGINHYLATIEKIAVNPIHYHPVALFQMRRETSGGHREDSECIGSHRPYQEQRQA